MMRILIINKSFELGGIQMALANLLEAICDEYDVTLAVFNPRGPMLERVPENVKLLKLSPLTEVLGMTKADCKKYGTLTQKVFKVLGSVWSRVFGNAIPVAIALAFQKNVGDYDVVISYHQETSTKTLVTGFGKFALGKCTTRRRIAWVHADFAATKLATDKNQKTYRKFDKIVCVSTTAMDHFVAAYPGLKSKCDYCYNPLPMSEIIEKSTAEKNVFLRNDGDVILFSACRLVAEKGLVPALNMLAPVFERHKNLKWFIAGVGPEENALKSIIENKHLEGQVILIGYMNNPYPYIRQADYLFLPSLHETYSMVAGEAHILGTSVIASDIPIMREILGDTDYICKDNNFASVIDNLMNGSKVEFLPEQATALLDWKTQFERILEC